jgi:hypothetical protein
MAKHKEGDLCQDRFNRRYYIIIECYDISLVPKDKGYRCYDLNLEIEALMSVPWGDQYLVRVA